MADEPDRERATVLWWEPPFGPPQRSIDITMILLRGIEQLAFTGMTFGTGPLTAQPAVFA